MVAPIRNRIWIMMVGFFARFSGVFKAIFDSWFFCVF